MNEADTWKVRYSSTERSHDICKEISKMEYCLHYEVSEIIATEWNFREGIGVPELLIANGGNSTLKYWRITASPVSFRSIRKKKLVRSGYFDILERYEQLNQNST